MRPSSSRLTRALLVERSDLEVEIFRRGTASGFPFYEFVHDGMRDAVHAREADGFLEGHRNLRSLGRFRSRGKFDPCCFRDALCNREAYAVSSGEDVGNCRRIDAYLTGDLSLRQTRIDQALQRFADALKFLAREVLHAIVRISLAFAHAKNVALVYSHHLRKCASCAE